MDKPNSKIKISRLILAALLPPLLGGVLFWILGLEGWGSSLKDFFLFFALAYYLMAIPSLLYALMMEFLIFKLIQKQPLILLFSSLLGLISAIFPYSLWFGLEGSRQFDPTIFLIGIATGLMTGVILTQIFRQQK